MLAVVRVLEALRVSQPTVGGPLDLFRIVPGGARRLDDDESDGLREQVDRWEEAEQRALDALFDGDP